MKPWHAVLAAADDSLHQALGRFGRFRILLVVDAERRLLGTVTDGDVRRALLRGETMDAPLARIMNPHPRTIPLNTPRSAALTMMKSLDIYQLPVVDQGVVVDLLILSDMVELTGERPNWTVILAGGQGKRLRPLTEHLPKPMLTVGGQPILETIVQELAAHGLRRLYLAVNYKAEIIKRHFGDGGRFGVEIRYLEENEPLGTAGPLGLLPERPVDPLLVMNGDVLTKADFGQLLAFHESRAAGATVGVRLFEMEVPYGVLEFEGDRVSAIVEKPVQPFKVSAGIYALDPAVLPERPVPLDMPDLLRGVIASGGTVTGFPIHEYWIDIGRPPEFRQAAADFDALFVGS
ncbi:nucleotidyltransferase family protein [Phaeospirillum tilakii]|uniref:Nucleotidyltransferase family protein n=1 Tax=Phaeospirillum tilakii TaxID=741673 RepID=A0ABW5CE14_9PROT